MSAHSIPSKRRIVFIDALRAYAILMMLQGHFTDTMLAAEYRDPANFLYALWYFMRGLTAPIFFFSTGLVFIYLLLKDGRPLSENIRVRKGIRRAFFLIVLGYLLRFNLYSLVTLKFYPSFFMLDVLHCIGLAILGLIGLYAFHLVSRISFPLLLGSMSIAVFLVFPDLKAADWSWLPTPLANYFTQTYGSVFTPIPWVGYAFMGGVLGYFINKRPQLDLAGWLPPALIGGGLMMHFFSTQWLLSFYNLTGWDNFQALAYDNTHFWRLGHVMIAVAIIMLITRLWKNMPDLVLKIGQETLTIYGVHYIVLYGSWFGIGLWQIGAKTLGPWSCALGAASFVFSFIILIAYIEQVRKFLYEDAPAFLSLILRIAKVKSSRFYYRLKYQKEPARES